MRYSLSTSICIVLAGCLDPYVPGIRADYINILVVDAFLDARDASAIVTLSRAVPLSDPSIFPSVRNAFVAIEDDLGNGFPLIEGDSGTYQVTGIPISENGQYRLHIRTGEQHEYYSEYVEMLSTPEIDSITYVTDDQKLTIRVNTHDDNGKAKFFRWTFDETWNYHAGLLSQFIVEGRGLLRPRHPDEMVYYCWNTKPSYDIRAFSTSRLSKSIVSQFPIQYITAGSMKLQMRYSILVKQQSISEQEYNYLEQLKKTTENVGGLFDPQPSQVTGNIKRTRSSSPVAVGYFSAGISTTARIYIDASDLPRVFREIYPPLGCLPPDTVCFSYGNGCSLSISDLGPGNVLGTAVDQGYTLTNARCADCRTQGGVTTKPDFWE